jgi:opacity protein-like surface antigen
VELGWRKILHAKFADGTELKDVAEWKSGAAFEGAVGAKMDMFRAELAFGYQAANIDKFSLGDAFVTGDELEAEGVKISESVFSIMGNVYADFDIDGGVAPYLMGGVGYANVDFKIDGDLVDGPVSLSKSAFAWQIGAGVGVKAAENITVDLGYRYFATADVDAGEGDKINCGASNILLGLRYDF